MEKLQIHYHRMGRWKIVFRLYHYQWNDFKFILIFNISSELDRSEDHQFRGYEEFEKGKEAIELENEEALDWENNYVANCRSD